MIRCIRINVSSKYETFKQEVSLFIIRLFEKDITCNHTQLYEDLNPKLLGAFLGT